MFRKTLILLSVLLSSLGLHAQTAQTSYLFLNGVERFLLGDIDGSTELLLQSIESDTLHSPSYFYLAKIAHLDHNYDTSMLMIGKALSSDSTNRDYLLLKAQVHLSVAEYEAAQEIFSNLLQFGHNPHYYIMNVALLLELGSVDQALKMCNDFELKYGLEEQLVSLKRMALVRTRNYFGAEEYMGRIVSTFPGSAEHLLAQADLNAVLRRDSVAIGLYRQAIALDSTSSDGYMALAEYYRKNDNVGGYIEALMPIFGMQQVSSSEKVSIFEKSFFISGIYRDHFASIRRLCTALLLSAPDNLSVRMLYGRFLTYTGQIDEGLEHYREIYNEGIFSEDLIERLSEILLYKKEFAQLEALLKRATLEYPKNVSLAHNQVISTWLSGRGLKAISLARHTLRRLDHTDSIRTTFHALMGDIYHELGRQRQCFASYNKALHYDTGNAMVLNNYAYYLSQAGLDLDRALAMATLATELSSANAVYLDTKAWVLFCMGQYEQAQQVQRAALGLDTSGESEYLLHYGDILYALCDDFLARTYWKKALDAGADAAAIEQRMARPKAFKAPK